MFGKKSKPELILMPEEHRKKKGFVLPSFGFRSPFGSFIGEVIKVAVISLAIVVPVRYFLIQPFFVRGQSMEPNFSDGQYLVIDEISYRLTEPKRGEVVVFKYPNDPSQYYIKRIVGLPNETVEVDSGRVIIYNEEFPSGVEIKENYLEPLLTTPGLTKVELGPAEYFVLGDNRRASSDSRVWGSLPADNIVGRVWVRGWPINEAGAFHLPQYELIGND